MNKISGIAGQLITQRLERARCVSLIVFVIGIFQVAAFSQNENIAAELPLDIKFEHLSMEERLSNGNVTKVLQDSRGFLWVATRVGLNRYDGYHFTIYEHDPDTPNSRLGCKKKSPSPMPLMIYPVISMFLALIWVHQGIIMIKLARYIRDEIEPKLPGLAWEQTINRESKRFSGFSPLGLFATSGLIIVSQILAITLGAVQIKSPAADSLAGLLQINFHQDIDVTILLHFTSNDGTEERSTFDWVDYMELRDRAK